MTFGKSGSLCMTKACPKRLQQDASEQHPTNTLEYAGCSGRASPGKAKPHPLDGALLRLSKKWLAPLFRGVHSSLAPTARPGSYARKPLLRKAFCGFDAHVAKSDQSLWGLRPPNPRGFFDRLGKAPSTGWGFAGLRPAVSFEFTAYYKQAPPHTGRRLLGAGGGTRTHTVSPPTDFESVTSANSITPAISLPCVIVP